MKYQVLNKLGQGGMGVVFRAHHTELDRDVAIKFLPAEFAQANPTAVQRFLREAESCIALNHPNVVKIIDAGMTDGRPFYVMELLSARDLEAISREHGALSPDLVLSVLDQVLDALAYCHAHSMIHRDVKPANIMLDASGRAILMDFGLVKDTTRTVLTHDGRALGTPRFMAPELIRGKPPSPANDLWSLGVTAWELLAGKRLFDAPVFKDLLAKIVVDPIPSLARACPGLPAGIDPIVMRLLERDLSRRYANASRARGDVRAAMDTLAIGSAGATIAGLAIGATGVPGVPSVSGVPSVPRASGAHGVSSVSGRTALPRSASPTGARAAIPAARPSGSSMRTILAVTCTLVIGLAGAALHHWRSAAIIPSPSVRSIDAGPGSPIPDASRATVLASKPPPVLAREVVDAVGATRLNLDRPWPEFDRLSRAMGAKNVRGVASEGAALCKANHDLAKPVEAVIDRLAHSGGLQSAFDALRPSLGAYLASFDTPPSTRASLLRALDVLQVADLLAQYAGLPEPFRALAAMAPAVEVSVREQKGPWSPAQGALTLVPCKAFKKYFLYVVGESPPKATGALGDVVTQLSVDEGDRAEDVDYGDRITLDEPRGPGPGGRRIDLLIASFQPAMALEIAVPDGPVLTIHHPPEGYEFLGTAWLCAVTLRGAMAGGRPQRTAHAPGGVGRWELRAYRTFVDQPRPYVYVQRVLSTTMP